MAYENATELACSRDVYCYPKKVQVIGLLPYVGTGGSFEVSTLYSDVLHVWLEGPELTVAHVHQTSRDPCCRFSVRYSVRLRGAYKLHIRIDQIGSNRIGFHREVFGSPYSVFANGTTLQVSSFRLPTCRSALAASSGSWVHRDRVVEGATFAPWLLATRDDYLWMPRSCRLLPLPRSQLARWYSRRICAHGDSYLRTLLAGMLLFSGLISAEEHQAINAAEGKSFSAAGTRYFLDRGRLGVTNRSAWHECARDAEAVVMGSLDGPSSFTHAVLKAFASRPAVSVVWMMPHPWSGQLLAHKRDNLLLRQVRARAQAALRATRADVLDVWAMANPRHDEACDGSHFLCGAPWGGRHVPKVLRGVVGLWEGLVLAHVSPGPTSQTPE